MDERLRQLKEQVKKGSISAAFAMAEGFKWGYFGAPDPARAARMYRYCCRSGNKKTAAQGYYNLGNLYYYGFLLSDEEREKQLRLAFSCFVKSALLCHSPEALSRLGDMYRYGQFVEQSEDTAIHLYLRANQGA
ncbi:MAG: hypothetical protein E7580_07150 [Ruminococcaceae bacterium]|nr:hypothetical protein [Oscillospiraceae bacterium]